jgi:hypothetical protein
MQEQTFRQWVIGKSKEIAEQWPPGGQDEKDLLAHWKTHRPKMYRRLKQMGIAKELAHVLINLHDDALQQNLNAGMPPTDAREQSEKAWLILEPEDEDSLILPEAIMSLPSQSD